MKNRRSEIATLFMVGTLVVIGVTAVISSLGLDKKQLTSSRASTYSCQTNGHTCVFRDDNPLTGNQFCTANGYVGIAVGTCPTNNICCRSVPATPKPPNTPIPAGVCDEVKCSTLNSAYTKGSYFIKDEDPTAYTSGCKTKLTSSATIFCKNLNPVNTATPVPSTGKGCGSGAQWACDASKGYDPVSCTTPNSEFRCCVQRSNGELVVYGCGGRYCSDIKLAGITACSTQAGYGTGAPGSIITKPGQTNPSEPPAGGGGSGGAGSTDPNCKAGSGNRFACDPTEGYNTAVCESPNMEFACCVQDARCPNGEARYRWYGCTGQPCQNTKIANALGHLVACPYGVDKSNQEGCESALPPPPTFPPSDPPDGGNTPPQMGECFAGLNQSDCNDETAVTGMKYTFNRTTKQCCPNKSPLETPPPDEPEDTPTPMPRLTNVECEEVKCPSPKIGVYARVKPLLSNKFLYFPSLDKCGAFRLDGRSEESVKAEVCKDPPPVQGPLPNTIITSPIPPINLQQPFQLALPPLDQITPGAPLIVSQNTFLVCHKPDVSLSNLNNFVQSVAQGKKPSLSICAPNEYVFPRNGDITKTEDYLCCPK